MKAPLLFRVDGSPAIGAGHVMRSLALAQAWQRAGGRVVFLAAEITPALSRRVENAGIDLTSIDAARGSADDAAQTSAAGRTLGAEWIVADGYCFDAEWQRQVRTAGLRLLIIDDYGQTDCYHADLILNQNFGADAALYRRRGPESALLLGSRFALLRSEFLLARPTREFPERAAKILVTLGGGDPDNVTSLVIAGLREIEDLEVLVVVGGSNPHCAAIEALAAASSGRVRVLVDAANMPDLMAWADLAIAAAGSTSWELACLGVPTIQVVIADNQREIAAQLARQGATISLGEFRSVTPPVIAEAVRRLQVDAPSRQRMSARASALVDGFGASRIAAAIGAPLRITLISDATSWLNEHLSALRAEWETLGHRVRWIHDPAELAAGDLAFFLSLSRLVPAAARRLHAHNLVVHESALPHGRGWSPLTWQILEGRNEIPVTLFEAADDVDAGEIYEQETIRFRGDELVDELRVAQADATSRLCRRFVARYPFVTTDGRTQTGEPTFYPRRRPADSKLDPDKTLREQFNLLRVCDPERYPAYFELAGRRYELRISAGERNGA